MFIGSKFVTLSDVQLIAANTSGFNSTEFANTYIFPIVDALFDFTEK